MLKIANNPLENTLILVDITKKDKVLGESLFGRMIKLMFRFQNSTKLSKSS